MHNTDIAKEEATLLEFSKYVTYEDRIKDYLGWYVVNGFKLDIRMSNRKLFSASCQIWRIRFKDNYMKLNMYNVDFYTLLIGKYAVFDRRSWIL